MTVATILGWILGLLAAAGIGYTLHATLLVRRLGRTPAPLGPPEPATLLKPLHGAEPRLAENLATFLRQEWAAPVQMVAGVADGADPAAAAARALGAELVVDPTRHGANGKVSNLVNMWPAAAHDLVVLSDSDMAVPPRYLAVLAGALARPGVGAATCLYRGRGDAGGWSRLAAAEVSYGFLPTVLVGLALGLARPCMGSTIALRRATLERIGGFRPLADRLADDYDLGAAVRALGLAVAVPPLVLVHGCGERSLAAVWRHELRWAATIRAIDPAGHVGSLVTRPVPLALLALPVAPRAGLALLVAALAARLLLRRAVDRVAGEATAPAWWLPARDCLSFALFVASLFARSVDWRGSALRMGRRGHLRAARSPDP